MTDIVKRLRDNCVGKPARIPWPHRILHEAADEIERLRAAIEPDNSVVKETWTTASALTLGDVKHGQS